MTEDDTAAIRRLRREVEDAENERDAAAFAALFTDDVAMLPVDGEPVHGASAVEAFHRDLYDSVDGMEVHFSIEDVRILGGLAVEHGTYTWWMRAPSGEERDGTGRYVYTWDRTTDDGWRISRMSWGD